MRGPYKSSDASPLPLSATQSPGPLLTVPAGVVADLGASGGSSTASTAPRASLLRREGPAVAREASSSSLLSEAARSARDDGDVFYDAEEYDGEGDAAPDAQMLRNTVTPC